MSDFKKFPEPKSQIVHDRKTYEVSEVDEVLKQWRQQLEAMLEKGDEEFFEKHCVGDEGFTMHMIRDLLEALPNRESKPNTHPNGESKKEKQK